MRGPLYAIMKKKFYISIISIFTLISCQQTKTSETELKKEIFDKDNNLIQVIDFYEREPDAEYKITIKKEDYDSIIYKYDNGQVFKTGRVNSKSQVIGKWNLFDRKGNLREIREYFIYEKKPILNRVWFLGENGDTLVQRPETDVFNQKEFIHDTLGVKFSSDNYFKFNSDTISLGEPVRGFAFCYTPKLREYGSEIRVFLDTEKEKFNSDFSNSEEILKQGYNNLARDTFNQQWFDGITEENARYIAVFGSWFETPGDKVMRGYMEEYAIGPFNDRDADSLITKTFFEKRIYVKDTIE